MGDYVCFDCVGDIFLVKGVNFFVGDFVEG